MVTLKGAGIERTLHFQGSESVKTYNDFVSSTDFCTKDYFHFFGLPAGKYEVEIIAKGFKPYLRTYVVKPGQPADYRAIEMVPAEQVTQ